RYLAVEEARGEQLNFDAGARECRREGAVVGGREGRWIYQLDFHLGRAWWDIGCHAQLPIIVFALAPALSYCVLNPDGRDYLLACLAAIEETHPEGLDREILVLDNASSDGSAAAVRALDGEIRLIELDQRTGKAQNDSTLLREARGRYCLLLNEDSEI